nr:replication-associated protein [Mute swan associated circo-like virus]
MKRVRALRYCFTINNYSEEELQKVKGIADWTSPMVKNAIAELEHTEVGSGTRHIQGYIHLKTRTDMNTLKNKISNRMHVEVARGSEYDNYKYCTKEGKEKVILEVGDFTEEIKSSKKMSNEEALEVMRDIKNLPEEEFMQKRSLFYLFNQNIYRDFRHKARLTEIKVYPGNLQSKNVWLWGKAGIGKSRLARQGEELILIFNKPYNKWWNGYTPETKRVIIDDYPAAPQGDALVQLLKIWGDRYPFTAELKGGHLAIEPFFNLIITSNYCINDCFTKDDDKEAIHRRFKEIEITENNNDQNVIFA